MAGFSRTLSLKASQYYLPKKDPKRPQGQDSCFINLSKKTIGVADGVGGIKDADSGIYARELMKNAYDFLENHQGESVDPMRVLQHTFLISKAGGASTVCIITLKDTALHAVNLGDSGFVVIREGKTVYQSPAQQQDFNCPYQLGISSWCRPSHAEEIKVDVEAGDVIVAGTDGLFDNLYDHEIEKIVKTEVQEGKPPASMAALLAQTARAKSFFKAGASPFNEAVAKTGRKRSGGKYDDVTVIVGCICAS